MSEHWIWNFSSPDLTINFKDDKFDMRKIYFENQLMNIYKVYLLFFYGLYSFHRQG